MIQLLQIIKSHLLGRYWICWSDGCYGVVYRCKDGGWSNDINDAKKYRIKPYNE